mmetsp:Transcript_30691/g.75482  ORF Transcript_30691/g.75482 Transcript_30691/m.75482 type:complete len:287 (-) Transcript_30691:174-1034(-)
MYAPRCAALPLRHLRPTPSLVGSRINSLALRRARHRRDNTGRTLLLPNGFLEQVDQASDKDAHALSGALRELLMAEVLAVVARVAPCRPIRGDEQGRIRDAELCAQLGLARHREAANLAAESVDGVHLRRGLILRPGAEPIRESQSDVLVEALDAAQRCRQLTVELLVKRLRQRCELGLLVVERDGNAREVNVLLSDADATRRERCHERADTRGGDDGVHLHVSERTNVGELVGRVGRLLAALLARQKYDGVLEAAVHHREAWRALENDDREADVAERRVDDDILL